MKNYVLGISCLYHNSAAALIKNGIIICAAEEERFTRIKGDSSFPINAIKFCLDSAKIMPDELFSVAYYENTGLKFERILTGIAMNAPRSAEHFIKGLPDWISNKLWIEKKIKKELRYTGRIDFIPHHLSHAASCFYPSPFEEAAILTVDGVGEWSACTWGIGRGNTIALKESINYPNSLGLLYSAFTLYTGFRINDGEYKMMGLAPYGKPIYKELIMDKLVTVFDDGSFVLNQKYFTYTYSMNTINKQFEDLFGQKARMANEPITQFYSDIAASIQEVTNEIIIKLAKHISKETGCKNLVLAGGVALNITANSKLLQSKLFENIWIAPASGDAGGALGAAFETYYRYTGNNRKIQKDDSMNNAFLGYSIDKDSKADDIILKKYGAVWTNLNRSALIKKTAELLAEGKVIGIAQGKAEFGPRALGHRSILADARNPQMLERLNRMIKFREGFRPFAPVVLQERAADYFDMDISSPYMLLTFSVKESRRKPIEFKDSVEETAKLVRSDIPAVTHIDYSARVQTVTKENNDFLYDVLNEFYKLTGCAVLVNTSFNVNGEPIVNTAEDSYKCFMKSGIDYAVIGYRFYEKDKQPKYIKK